MCKSEAKPKSSKIDAWIEQHKVLSVLIAAAFLVILIGIGSVMPDKCPEIIRNHLSDHGFAVGHITFEKVEQDSFWATGRIYRASEAIEYIPGVLVDEWKVTDTSIGSRPFASWSVTPHPALPSPVELTLRLSVAQEDYDRLAVEAGEQAVEEYLKQYLIDKIMAADKDAS